MKEDSIRIKVINEENERFKRNFEDQLKVLGEFGTAGGGNMGNLRGQRNITQYSSYPNASFDNKMQQLQFKDDTNPWENLNFLDTLTEKLKKDPNLLLTK